jgi:DNA replication protein DnaC
MNAVLLDRSLLSKGSWFFHGNTGSGKSFHAGVFGHDLIRHHGLPLKFIQVSEYMSDLKSSFSARQYRDIIPSLEDPMPTSSEALLATKKSDVLIMDDLNRRYTEFEMETIYDIVDYRHRNKLFTIFTAQDPKLPMLPEETVSRITDMAHPYWLGPTNRRKGY